MIAFSSTPTVPLDSTGGQCMYAQVDQLRDMGPAVAVQLPEGVAAWSVSRGDVVKRLLTHPGVSRDLKGTVPGYEPGSVAWLSPWVDIDHMATADGKEHARLRKLITPAFSPRRVGNLQPQVQAVVARLLDDLEALPADQPIDLHAAFSYRVPTETICDLFGVPDDQRAELLRLFRAVGETDKASEDESVEISNGLIAAMHALIDARRRDPGDDLTSFLIAAREEGSTPLTEDELIATLLLMIGGGSGTLINLLDHTVRELTVNRDQLHVLQQNPDRWSDAIEESLRLHCPVMHLPMRWATEDIDLGDGVVIRAGDAILIAYGAHGRDPAVHERPEVFDIDRENKEHIAFSLGPHFCPGSRLALLEAGIALRSLFERFPRLELAVEPDEIEPEHTFIGNGVASLPVLLHHRSR
ncbi:cytochrome P450 family protein [Actinoplanes solisilvae]|uniref:cytochrome P450 family protein n=1 Tax=Actinoplanes solisilvae TaxID=2486853 RepID=UPI00196AAB2E|nr:cytochrome P450 [Actinoplanes solisilvae]